MVPSVITDILQTVVVRMVYNIAPILIVTVEKRSAIFAEAEDINKQIQGDYDGEAE